jgi:hypothetical protein
MLRLISLRLVAVNLHLVVLGVYALNLVHILVLLQLLASACSILELRFRLVLFSLDKTGLGFEVGSRLLSLICALHSFFKLST